jgi:opacity protein-like surface antigen
MKELLLFSLMLAFSVVTAHAYAPQRKGYAPKSKAKAANQANVDEMKLGLQGGINIFSSKAGAYLEYKFTEALGIQSGLCYFSNSYALNLSEETVIKFAWVTPKYLTLPIMLRGYPGADRQFCFFGGIHGGYLISGKQFLTSSEIDFRKRKRNKKRDDEVKNLKEIDQHNKFDFSIVAGFDYEFSFGLTLGLSYNKGFIDVIKASHSLGNFTLQPTIGYNIATLLK